jgi:hypothetical protein
MGLMLLLQHVAMIVFWCSLWTAVPAALLYPFALWMARYTRVSAYAISKGYVMGIGLLVIPTGFLIDFLYRHFVLKRRARKPQT